MYRNVSFSNTHLLLEEKDLGFNQLLSDLLHDELLAALGFYSDLAASSTAAVPRARAAWGEARYIQLHRKGILLYVNDFHLPSDTFTNVNIAFENSSRY